MIDSPDKIPLRFFQSLHNKDYEQVWNYLTHYSQQVLVQILSKSWKTQSLEELTQDFEKGQGIAKSYWESFRESVQVETWLAQSYRSFGPSGREVFVKASPSQVRLIVFKEGPYWKFGYFETFLDNK